MSDARRAPGGLRLSGGGTSTSGVLATVADVVENTRASEAEGFDYMSFGDTVFREVFSTLTACATATGRIALGPSVVNPLTRSPIVSASAIATVDEVSGGRAFLGIGMGQSANAIAGLPQATPEQLRRAIVAVNSAFRLAAEHEPWPDGVEVDESLAALQWVTRRVPILVAAGFEQGLRIAAELGDGVMLRAGDVDWASLPARVDQLLQWRAESPRVGDPFEVQLLLPAVITDDVADGRAILGGIVSARARTSMRSKEVPAELLDAWKQYRAEYDYVHHASNSHPVNTEAMTRVGLADYAFDRFSVIGDEDVLLAKLEEVEAAGITATTLGGPTDRARTVLAEYRRRRPLDGTTSPLRPLGGPGHH